MSQNDENKKCACSDPSCCTPAKTSLSRRQFLATAGAGAAGFLAAGRLIPAMAGPFEPKDFENLIPSDKKLSPDWVKSLFERTKPTTYHTEELKFVGMPIGGICCGQLYLGGDGKLWHWDIFRSDYQSAYGTMSMGIHYSDPPVPQSPLEQGFAVKITADGKTSQRSLDSKGFQDIKFQGQYPIGRVAYRDKNLPVDIDLEAFSPFIPLNHDDSALPTTIMSFTVTNNSNTTAEIELAGFLQNAVCLDHDQPHIGRRQNRLIRRNNRFTLSCSALGPVKSQATQPDIIFADFEGDSYENFQPQGQAFGDQPFPVDQLAPHNPITGYQNNKLVNSHNTRLFDESNSSNLCQAADNLTGKLTSKPFTINRNFINFQISGGNHAGKTCLNLIVDSKIVQTATGQNSNRMRTATFDVSDLLGKNAHLEIIDSQTGSWGNIAVDHITFSDQPPHQNELENLPGYGSMALSIINPNQNDSAALQLPNGKTDLNTLFASLTHPYNSESTDSQPSAAPLQPDNLTLPFGQKLIGALSRKISLEPGKKQTIDFAISWFFPYYPNVTGEFSAIQDIHNLNRHYENRFSGASSVAAYLAANFRRLAGQTRLWNQTWYDSTLPHWFLDRTFISLDCLATQTCHWFDNGRFYGWEGVCCCPGTCQHVWNYAQGLARIFPHLERTTRENIDYGIAYHPDGALDYRAESSRHVAHDGQCGTIIRAYREHLTSANDAYLKRNWKKIKKSIQYMIDYDGNDDGLIEKAQYNTLDQAWVGPMAWISSMYLAAVAVGKALALEMNDPAFAQRCDAILTAGKQNITEQLFNGEYFIHKPPNFEATNTNDGCHIDQVLGQSFAFQVGLGQILTPDETVSALKSLWKYNFSPDAGGYRNKMQSAIKGGRWYAMPGEAGLLMTTWPKGGAEKAHGTGKVFDIGVGYFNECMNGFEYQAASHMIYQGKPDSDLTQMGLAVTRAVHDRYNPLLRNPYNEIECSDHYSRSMASYGVFLAACGYDYHGPKGHLAFAPRINPNKFRAPFTAAQGWGTFSQQRFKNQQTNLLELKLGSLRLSTLALTLPDASICQNIDISVTEDYQQQRKQQQPQKINADFSQQDSKLTVTFEEELRLQAPTLLKINIKTN